MGDFFLLVFRDKLAVIWNTVLVLHYFLTPLPSFSFFFKVVPNFLKMIWSSEIPLPQSMKTSKWVFFSLSARPWNSCVCPTFLNGDGFCFPKPFLEQCFLGQNFKTAEGPFTVRKQFSEEHHKPPPPPPRAPLSTNQKAPFSLCERSQRRAVTKYVTRNVVWVVGTKIWDSTQARFFALLTVTSKKPSFVKKRCHF